MQVILNFKVYDPDHDPPELEQFEFGTLPRKGEVIVISWLNSGDIEYKVMKVVRYFRESTIMAYDYHPGTATGKWNRLQTFPELTKLFLSSFSVKAEGELVELLTFT